MLIKRKDWNDVGVSEVIGTILILGMTVTLFSAVLIWVYTIPTPTPNIKVDFVGQLEPIYKTGVWDGVNITVRHNSGEALQFSTTKLYLTIQVGTNRYVDQFSNADKITIPPFYASPQDNNKPYGLIDGSDKIWNAGERWFYTNHKIAQADTVEAMIVDTGKSVLLWRATLQGLAGLNPPVFVDKWADKDQTTSIREPPATGVQFYVYANVIDPDGDLNKQSVYANFTGFWGIPDYRSRAQKMLDNGTGGDQVANDGIFTFTAFWLKPTNMSWDGSVVIFNATDLQGHKTISRMTLTVVAGPSGGGGGGKRPPSSGAPPNLNYNGLQGYNIFNATEWDTNGYAANETRTFKEGQEVVIVVGSAIMKDLFGKDQFLLYDPFSNTPLSPVVYGSNKQVTPDSVPSSTQAFQFLEYVAGYNVWVYRFELNNQSSVGINFAKNPTYPPQYYFGSYPLMIDLIDFNGNRFATSDTIKITATDGTVRNYPVIETYISSAYTTKTSQFNSTDIIYVQVLMNTVDGSPNTVLLGNVVIQDFTGGYQVFRAPKSGPPQHANPPICPVTGTCTYNLGTVITINNPKVAYRFAINLTQANQDPWIDGAQHYALRILTLDDSNEHYSLALSAQLTITAPLWRLDMAIGLGDATNPAWGSHDVSFWFLNWNGVDKWTQGRFEAPYPKKVDYVSMVRYIDFNQDGKLDVAVNLLYNGNNLIIYRQDSDQGGNMQWTKNIIDNPASEVTDCRPGSLNNDSAPELVCGDMSGNLWYYLNDGTWTIPGQPATKKSMGTWLTIVNMLDVGDFNGDKKLDVAVARPGGNVAYFIGNGAGKFTAANRTTDGTNVVGLDVGDYNNDGFDDVFVGTAGGKIFRMLGSSGGLQPATQVATGVGVILDLKLGNITGLAGQCASGKPGLCEVAVVVGTQVKVYNANTGAQLGSPFGTTSAAPDSITAFAMGDIDGNGHDDLMVGTLSGNLVYYRWTPTGWQAIPIFNGISGEPITTQVYDLDLGDMSKAQYMSR